MAIGGKKPPIGYYCDLWSYFGLSKAAKNKVTCSKIHVTLIKKYGHRGQKTADRLLL